MIPKTGRRLFAATSNPDKLGEFRRILYRAGFEVIGKEGEWDYPDPEETGVTLAENALIKAHEGHRRTGLPAFADDTGLEVDALQGDPGVFSARYAGPGASYADNVRRLLQEMNAVPTIRRTARFRCVIAFVDFNREQTWEGVAEGLILKTPRGRRGFGYDSVFWSFDLEMSFGEATPNQKHSVSHRARALRVFASYIKELAP